MNSHPAINSVPICGHSVGAGVGPYGIVRYGQDQLNAFNRAMC
jgi:hypothetical protein